MTRSDGPSLFLKDVISEMAESRMLPLARAAASCAEAGPPSPNSCSNTRRGLLCVGSGVVGEAPASVVWYAQLYPVSQPPVTAFGRIAISSEGSAVSFLNRDASTWSIDT